MRALVLGGAGAVCKETTRDLAQYSDFEEIVVADYSVAAAQALVEELGDPRLKVLSFNADDYDGKPHGQAHRLNPLPGDNKIDEDGRCPQPKIELNNDGCLFPFFWGTFGGESLMDCTLEHVETGQGYQAADNDPHSKGLTHYKKTDGS